MRILFFFSFFFQLIIPISSQAQQVISGTVYDAQTKQTIPFATIKFGSGKQGVIAGLNGFFQLSVNDASIDTAHIEVSCMGYEPRKIALPLTVPNIYLAPVGNTLEAVTVRPPYEKIRRILNSAIDNKGYNNPDKYDRYRCNIYYKMVADVSLPDSIMQDTAARNVEKADFVNNQHIMLSETYSVRTWQSPMQLQEEVLATRLSGLKHSVFTSMITDVLPFHSYADFITLNGKDYHNPVSKGFERNYRLNLVDEMLDGTDTLWIISFRPRGIAGNRLSGKVYIHSAGYAISQLIAEANDTILKQVVRVEQQYNRLDYINGEQRWFPVHLNYLIDRELVSNNVPFVLHMKGYSQIDSVTWMEEQKFRFDKRHTVKLTPDATLKSDSILGMLRPAALNAKEKRTYKVIDSFGEVAKLDKIMTHVRNLPEGRYSFPFIDLELARILSYNKYENIRLSLGAQTNDDLIKWLSVGGWGGYGFGDKKWKYGAFAEFYADKYKEFAFRVGYTDDITDPGRIRLSRDLDRNYLRMFLLQRVDQTKTYSFSVRKKIAYWGLELSALQQEIIPQYDYALHVQGAEYSRFTTKEASLNVRYAYAERTAPFLGTYYKLVSKYPIYYAKVTTGIMETGSLQNAYTQVVTAAAWQKHINRLGTERIMIEAGKSWSQETLPLGKLFAGNGFKYDTKSLLSIYAFGGLMTMYPYEYYTDHFVQINLRHDFDWKVYKLEPAKSKISSAPNIGLQYNMLFGRLDNRQAQERVTLGVPKDGYFEAGLLLNNLIRLRSGNMYYRSLNIGYFYNLTSTFDLEKNGKLVFGLSLEL